MPENRSNMATSALFRWSSLPSKYKWCCSPWIKVNHIYLYPNLSTYFGGIYLDFTKTASMFLKESSQENNTDKIKSV